MTARRLLALTGFVSACGGANHGPGGDPVPAYGIRLLEPTPEIQKLAAEQPGGASVDNQIQAVSADGSVIAGTSTAVMNDSGSLLLSEPFRFSMGTGTVGLGTLPDQAFNRSRLISADGSTIVGETDYLHTFRWTKESGKQDLGTVSDSIGTIALDVSEDGSAIVGASRTEGGDGPPRMPRAVRWTNGTLTALIDDIMTYSAALLVRSRGSVILGMSVGRVFRWTEAGGIERLDGLAGDLGDFYEVAGASSDGSIFAGTRAMGPGGGGQVFRFTPPTGMVALEPMATYTQCGATKMSSDGSVIVGYCDRVVNDTLESEQAFRWTEGTGMLGLGFLPGFPNSFAICMSADGSVIVGNSGFDTDTATPFVWDEANGIRPLRSLFEDDPVTKSGFTIDRGPCISADGQVLFGEMQPHGQEVRAWIARLPPRP